MGDWVGLKMSSNKTPDNKKTAETRRSSNSPTTADDQTLSPLGQNSFTLAPGDLHTSDTRFSLIGGSSPTNRESSFMAFALSSQLALTVRHAASLANLTLRQPKGRTGLTSRETPMSAGTPSRRIPRPGPPGGESRGSRVEEMRRRWRWRRLRLMKLLAKPPPRGKLDRARNRRSTLRTSTFDFPADWT